MPQVHGGKLVSKALKRHGVTHLLTPCGEHIQARHDDCLHAAIASGLPTCVNVKISDNDFRKGAIRA